MTAPPAPAPSTRLIDPRPLSSDDYRELLTRQKWTHGRAGRVLGISERTTKVYAAHGVPSGLAAVALRSLVDAEPGELTGPPLEALQDAARKAAADSRQIKAWSAAWSGCWRRSAPRPGRALKRSMIRVCSSSRPTTASRRCLNPKRQRNESRPPKRRPSVRALRRGPADDAAASRERAVDNRDHAGRARGQVAKVGPRWRAKILQPEI